MAIFVPSTRLLNQVGPSGLVLCMGTDDWFTLQGNIQSVLALPYDFAEFETRYGDPSSGLPMREAFDAMHALQQVANGYGSPRGLRTKLLADPNLLAGASQPKGDVYLSTAWTLQRAHEDAAQLARVLTAIPDVASGKSPADVVAGIKSLFQDSDQMLDRVNRTISYLTNLISQMESIEGQLAEAKERMSTYTATSSQTMAFLNKEIGELQADIQRLEKQRDEAWKKWRDLTIAAVVVPAGIAILGVAIMVVLAIPTGGGSFAVGAAVTTAAAGAFATGLGVAASNARTEYDGLVNKVKEEEATLAKRVTYRHDLGALEAQMKFSLPASQGVTNQLTIVRDAWKSLGAEMQAKVADLSTTNLSTGPWLRAPEMADSAAAWSKVDQAIRAFNINALVDTNLLSFGAPLPADDPNWKSALANLGDLRTPRTAA